MKLRRLTPNSRTYKNRRFRRPMSVVYVGDLDVQPGCQMGYPSILADSLIAWAIANRSAGSYDLRKRDWYWLPTDTKFGQPTRDRHEIWKTDTETWNLTPTKKRTHQRGTPLLRLLSRCQQQFVIGMSVKPTADQVGSWPEYFAVRLRGSVRANRFGRRGRVADAAKRALRQAAVDRLAVLNTMS